MFISPARNKTRVIEQNSSSNSSLSGICLADADPELKCETEAGLGHKLRGALPIVGQRSGLDDHDKV